MLTVVYRWLVEFAVLGVFILPTVATAKLVEAMLSAELGPADARLGGLLAFLAISLALWARFNVGIRRPLLARLPR